MINFRPTEVVSFSSSVVTAEKALSLISKRWREVKDSADADLQLMRDRANSFKTLASSFDRDLENFLTSASRSTFSIPSISAASTPVEVEFVKGLQPKFTEFRQAYSSPDFSRRVLEKWTPRPSLWINFSALKNAIVSEVEDFDQRERFRSRMTAIFKEERENEEGLLRDWEPIKAFKLRLREFEQRNSSSEISEC